MRACLVILFAFFALSVRAVELTWDSNPDPATVGYRVYYGDASGVYTNAVDAASPTASIPTLPGQTYFFAVTSYNAAGLECNFSSELRYTSPTFPPLTITVLRGPSLTGARTTAAIIIVTNNQPQQFFWLEIQ